MINIIKIMKRSAQWLKAHRKFCLAGLVVLFIVVGVTSAVLADSGQNWAVPPNSIMHQGDNNPKIKNNPSEYIAFYQHFSHYLTPHEGYLSFFMTLAGAVLQGLCGLVDVLQKMFEQSVKLMGFFSSLNDQKSTLGQLFHASQIAGIIIFALSAVVYGFFSVFHPEKENAKKLIQTLILLTFGFSFIPFCLNSAQGFTTNAIEGYQQSVKSPDMGTSILQDNVVDKYVLTAKNWDVTLKEGLVDDTRSYNHIKNIGDFDAGEMAGVMTQKIIKSIDDSRPDVRNASAQVIFENYLYQLPNQNGESNQSKFGFADLHKNITSLNMFEKNYFRYKVNWLPAFLEAIAICALLVLMTFKVIASIFQILTTGIVGPVLVAIRSNSPKKAKEIFSSMIFGCAGIGFDFIIIYCALGMMSWLQTGDAAEILNALPAYGSLLIRGVAYVAIFMGAFSGVGIVEKFLGVSSGHGNALRQVMAGAVIARATGASVRGAAGLTFGAGKFAGRKLKETFGGGQNGGGDGMHFVPPATPSYNQNNGGASATSGSQPTPPNGHSPQNGGQGNQGTEAFNPSAHAPQDGQATSTSPTANEAPLTRAQSAQQAEQGQMPNGPSGNRSQTRPDNQTHPYEPVQGNSSQAFENGYESGQAGQEAGNLEAPEQENEVQQPTTSRYERLMQAQGEQLNQIQASQAQQEETQKKNLERMKKSARAQKAQQYWNQAHNNLGQVGAENHIGKQEESD